MQSRSLLHPYNRLRLWCIVGLFGIVFTVILGRLYRIQVLQHAELHERASKQYLRYVTLRSDRGHILDRHGHVLATSVLASSLYAVPSELDDPPAAALQLAEVLRLGAAEVSRRLADQTQFVWLARQVSPDVVARVQALGLKGVYVRREARRYYPKRHLAGQVLGFVGIDGEGLGGLEYQYDKELAGQPLRLALRHDAVGRQVRQATGVPVAPPRGADVVVTLDEWLQHLAERELAAQVLATGAKSGLVLMMQPHSGDLLAVAAYPFFDPNQFRDPQQRAWQRNRAITDPVEPGSTFKLMVAAAALEEDMTRPDELFFCENGSIRLGRRQIRDHEPYGWLSFADIFAYSSNIGVVKISGRLRPDQLYHYIRRFGFGEKSHIGLPGEAAGQIRAPASWSHFSPASLAIGQEVAVTPLQLVTAFAVLANGGNLVRPRIVRHIDHNGHTQHMPAVVRHRVISPASADQLTTILTQAVAYGTGQQAGLENYLVAGKTGTAQKVDPQRGGYSSRKVLASFVGYVPAQAPQFVMLVMLDEPQRLRWGGQAAAPVFRRIAQQALPYLQVPAGQGYRLSHDRPVARRLAQRGSEVGRSAMGR